MTDNITARIAAIIDKHWVWDEFTHDDGRWLVRCKCNSSGEPEAKWLDDYPEHVAAAVVTELGLTQEPCQGQPKTRYVTDWERDD